MVTLKNKNIVVTGGTGFIGSHLISELLRQGANVVTTHQSIKPSSYFISNNLANRVDRENVDVSDFDALFSLITKFSTDFIFHLAAQPLVEVGFYNPRKTLFSNIVGTFNILECARLYPKVKSVIIASSDKAYGKLLKGKYVETDALRGDHPYEVSKSSADLIAQSYFKTYRVPVVTTRFGNIYGEGDLHFSRIVPSIMRALIKNEVLDIRSNGKFIRDYLYVKDAVRAYIDLAKNINIVKGQAFNLGSDESLSVKDLIRLVEKTLGKKIQSKILNNSINEIPYQSLNSSKIKSTIHWEQKNKLVNVIPSIYAWYQKFFLNEKEK